MSSLRIVITMVCERSRIQPRSMIGRRGYKKFYVVVKELERDGIDVKMKKTMRHPLIVFGSLSLITTLLLVGVLLYQVKGVTDNDNNHSVRPTSPLVEESQENYQLSDMATAYQKEIFEELIQAQEDYQSNQANLTKEAYVELVVKNFIADFYTWSNKTGRNDVGGLQFIDEEMKSNFRKQAIDNFYENLDYYLKDYDETSLLTVNNVTILDVNLEDTIEVVDEVIECISVKASWEYEKTSLEDVEKFQNEATFILTESNDDVVIKAILGE